MILVDNLDLTMNVEAYQHAVKTTAQRWVRNNLTGKLYRETAGIDGAVIRYHVIGCILDSEQHESLLEKYTNRESVTFTSDEFANKSCIIVEDEFKLEKIAGADAYQGTIAFEEITKID